MSMIFVGRLGAGELSAKSARLSAESVQWMDEAQKVMAAARDEADAILRAARAEAETLKAKAKEQGTAEGFSQGQVQVATLLADTYAKAGRHLRDLEPALVDAVVQAVGKLVGDVGHAKLIERAVLLVRERLAEADGLVLKIHPDIEPAAREAATNLTQQYGLTIPIRVEKDVALKNEQCVIESSLGRAEVRLEDQLARLRQVLTEAFAVEARK